MPKKSKKILASQLLLASTLQDVQEPIRSSLLDLHHHGLSSASLFEEMLDLDMQPDHITYVGLLSACTHVRLVERAKKFYELMINVHKIEPTLSRYACMIDFYGRAGLLQESYEFIENMHLEPDVVSWGSLLASCKVHQNTDLAKVAAEKLLLIEPGNSGAYSALANAYSACGKWAEAVKIRKLMTDRGEQLFSWVHVQNKVHVSEQKTCLIL